MDTFYRIQRAEYDVNDLLDPAFHTSHAYNGNKALTRHGVSACSSLRELAEYLGSGQAGALDPRGARGSGWVIVSFEGALSGDSPVDIGEVLAIPSRIVSVDDVDADFLQMIDDAELELFGEDEILWD
jgi:hypothetical protein